MDNVTLRGATLSFMRTLSKPPVQRAIVELDPEVAKRLKEAREQASQASKTLESTKTDVAEQRKSAAKVKLELIKRSLRTLTMMGGDAKTMAREGARLARELAAAVKEYAAAGVTGGASAPAPAGAPAAAASTPADGKAAPATPDADAAPAAEARTEDAGGGEGTQGGGEGAEGKSAEDAAVLADTAQADATKADATRKDADSDGKGDPDTFADEARLLAKKLKALLNQQKERLKSEASAGSAGAEREVTGALDELRKTERTLHDLPAAGDLTGAAAAPPMEVDLRI
jgi:hypothetical protein